MNYWLLFIFFITLCTIEYYQQKYIRIFETLHKIILGQADKTIKYGYTIKNKKIILRPNLKMGYEIEFEDFNGAKL